jgi:hypothetical protein
MSRMSASDRSAWQAARTLADLGELTAQWLEGGITSIPGYCGRPDEETEALIPALARLNRAGFVTDTSQPGLIEHGGSGTMLEQRAAVQGYAGLRLISRLAKAAGEAGMLTILFSPAELPRWRYRYGQSVTVTRVNGRRFTGFGVQLPRRHIRDGWIGYGICHPDATAALCSAWQVTVADPEWGRPDVLWRVLEQAIQPGPRCGTGGRS